MQTTLEKPTVKKQTAIEFHKPTLSREDLKGVLECLAEEQLSFGSTVERFEKDFAHTFKFKYAVSANSLTGAYHLAFLSLGIGEGDEVLLSPILPAPALDALFLLRAKPVLVDIAKSSFHMDPEKLTNRLLDCNPKLIILDHAFGSILDKTKYDFQGIPVLEDFTEVLGAEVSGIGKVSNLGICGLGSDNLITTGNGAMLVTQDSKLVEQIRIHQAGRKYKRILGSPKFDYNLIDYQAALGIEQLSKLGVILERQRKIALAYLQAVQSSRLETYFGSPMMDSFQKFPVVVSSQSYEEVERYFRSIRIGTKRVVDEPLHHLLEEKASDYPNAERLYQKGHLLPIYPNLTKDNVQRIATALRRIY